jgi:hypothetical protein
VGPRPTSGLRIGVDPAKIFARKPAGLVGDVDLAGDGCLPGRGQANDTSAIGPAERGNRRSAGSYRGASLPPLIPLHQLILCSGAFFLSVAFDRLGLPPACCVANHGHFDVEDAEACVSYTQPR